MMHPDNSGNYLDYEIEDFICDPAFQDWIIHPDAENELFWQEWIRHYPEKAATVQQARSLLRSVQFAEYNGEKGKAELSFTEAREKIVQRQKKGLVRRISPLFKAAAVLLIIVTGVLLYRYSAHRSSAGQTLATAYGTIRSVYLPDSSKMVLNSHSKVQYAQNWKAGSPRELWLEGEAFFDVHHPVPAPGGKDGFGSFLVYTKDLTVEVLSTVFNVRERRGRTEVVLGSGKIKVHFRNNDRPDILMKPGDQLTYDPQQQTITRAAIIPENYISWKDKKLTNATGQEIVEYLEDNYGKKVILEDPTMAAHQFGGEVMLDKFDDALFALSTVMNVKIIQKNDTLIFRPK